MSFLCISEVNRVSSNLSLERMEQQFSPCLPSDTLGDTRMVDIENPKKEMEIRSSLTIWLLGGSVVII